MDNFQIQPQMPPARQLGPSVQPYLPRQDHRKRNWMIVLCVIAAVVIITGVLWFAHTYSPAYRIQKGFLRLMKEAQELQNPMEEKLGLQELSRRLYTEGGEVNTKLNTTLDTFLGEFTLGMDTDYVKDRRERKMSSSTAFSIMNYEFGHLDVYADEDNLCFSVPELFIEDLYLENENVLAQYNRSMWADDWLFGEAEGDDFSIDLFSSPWYLEDEEGAAKAFLKRYAGEIEACGRNMKLEKAGDDVFRIRLEGSSFNYLVWRIISDYLNDNMNVPGSYREDMLGFLSYFDAASGPEEICLLVEMGGADRIESIRLEHPLSLGRSAVRIDGDVYFLGGKNSLERMQGRIAFDNKDGEGIREQEILWQVVRSLEEGEYQMESEVKYSYLQDEVKHTVKLEGDFSYDGPKNSFQAGMSADIEETEFGWEASGDFSHIKKGESFELDLDEIRILTDGEQTMSVKGEIHLGPLSRRVKQIAEPKTDLFSMGDEEWMGILEKIDKAYGYLWETMAGYLW